MQFNIPITIAAVAVSAAMKSGLKVWARAKFYSYNKVAVSAAMKSGLKDVTNNLTFSESE